jgi:cell division protein FtsQ
VKGAAATLAGRRTARRGLALPSLSARMRRRLLLLVALCLLVAGSYQFWLRESALVAVEDVQVVGLTTKDAKRVRGALEIAARSMTTLHVRHERLDQAIAPYPVVRALDVSADFPHGLRIRVIEHHPAALADLGDREVAVARDGTLLTGLPVEGRLPRIEAQGAVEGERLSGRAALAAARVAGAAPSPLRRRLEAVGTRRDDGLVVKLLEGPELIFGAAAGVEAKWIAAARVLADPDAKGATYVDVRLPGRPAAGGLPAATVTPVAPAGVPSTPGALADPATGAPAPAVPVE